MTENIKKRLLELQDEKYRLFQAKLMPGVELERIIGVRTPALRKLGKELAKTDGIETFLQALPHQYYDEYNLHGFIISECRDYDKTVAYLDALLTWVDNWATCDLLSPKIFKKNRDRLAADIDRWIASDHTYTIRFGMEMIMSHYLDQNYDRSWLEKVAVIRSEEYYVNMMIAWFFATALAKQWDDAATYIVDKRLDVWTHNKTIQKAVESDRITAEQKVYLRGLKRKKTEELYTCSQMNEAEARSACEWKYEGEYAVYNFPTWEEVCQRGWSLADAKKRKGAYYSVYDGKEMIGFFHIMPRIGRVELGIGMKPERCGRHQGKGFVETAVQMVEKRYPDMPVVLLVKAVNKRAIRCYESCGFQITEPFFESSYYVPGEMVVMRKG